MWDWSGPEDASAELPVYYLAGETLYDPPSAQEFNLHYVCWTSTVKPTRVFAVTVTIPISVKDISASESTEPPTLKLRSTPIRSQGPSSFGCPCRKGLHSDIAPQSNGFDILVTPLDDLIVEGGRGALRMTVPYKELVDRDLTITIDMDGATGRVVIWKWNKDARETRVFVGDLV